MSEGLTIAFGIIGALGTIFGIIGVSAYFQQRAKHRAELRNQQEDAERDEFEEFEQNKRKEAMREVIREEINPLEDKIIKIEDNTQKSLNADVLSLRCNMKTIEERCKTQGYSDIGDKATMKKLRKQYEDLGGNDFRDYVNRWCEVVEELPDEKIKKSKKEILNESK